MRPSVDGPRRTWATKNSLGAFLLAAVMLLSALAVASASASPTTPGSSAVPSGSPASAPATAPAVPHPSGGNSSVDQTTGTFFSTNSTFAPVTPDSSPCYAYNYTYNFGFEILIENYQDCYAGPQDPSIVNFGGSDVGVGYSDITNYTAASSCSAVSALNGTVVSGVAFQRSNNSGQNWNSPVWIGNATCAYYQAFEPSFGYSGGTVYGTFVESSILNATAPPLPQLISNRSSAALGFTTSTNGGVSFSEPVTLGLAGYSNIANPRLAAFGDTVYIVYENLTNVSSATLPTLNYGSAPYYPESVNLIYSSDGGATWNGPYTLPGENASDYYTATAPDIAVNSAGEIAVSYATNRSCIMISGFCYDYGESIVVATSTTNGTSWSGPYVVTQIAGEDLCAYETYNYYCSPVPFTWGPTSTVAFSPTNPNDIDVAWVASYYTWNVTTGVVGEGGSSGTASVGYGSALFAGVSTNNGVNWTTSTVYAPETAFGYDEDHLLNPAITVAPSGKIYISFTWDNETCFGVCTPPFSYTVSYWVASSTNGVTWSEYVVDAPGVDFYEQDQDWTGLTGAITVDSTGPVAIYSEGLGEIELSFGYAPNLTAAPPIYEYWWNYSLPTDLIAAFVSTASPAAINFTESGIPGNLTWGFTLSGNVFTSNATTIEVTNIPRNSTLYYSTLPVNLPNAGWTELVGVATIGQTVTFAGPGTVWVNFTKYFGVQFRLPFVRSGPAPTGGFSYVDIEIDLDIAGVFYEYYYYFENYMGTNYSGTQLSTPFPWYFPIDDNVTLGSILFSSVPLSFVYGSGNGSATGAPDSAVMDVLGPINETFFAGALGEYNVSFTPEGLPSGTPYSFEFAGTTYSGTAPASVYVGDVFTGEYPLADATAASMTNPGWDYYAPTSDGEVDVPLTVNVRLNFTSEVDVAGTPGTVSFEASGLATGDFWQLTFNGTTYGSSTPWVNLTVKDGNYAVSAPPVAAAANDSVAYTAGTIGPSISVTTGSTYSVTFSLSYRVQVSAAAGGTVTGLGSHWAAPGSTASYEATVNTGYTYLGWSGSGAGSYSGPSAYANVTVNGPISETAQFQPLPGNHYSLSVSETGLPAGSWWTVVLNGSGYSTDTSTLVIAGLYSCSDGAQGQYPMSVPYVYVNGTSGVRYTSSGFPATTCTTGTTTLTVTFHGQYLVTPSTNGHGTVTLSVNGNQLTTATWITAGSSISISASADPGYTFAGWLGTGAGSYTGSNPSPELTPAGAVTELATFAPVVVPPATLYNVSFQLTSALAPGTTWSVNFNGTNYGSTGGWINVSGLVPNTYTAKVGVIYSPDRTVEYTPRAPSTSVDVTGNQHVQVGYTNSYWVSVESNAGGTVTPSASAYYPSGTTLTLVATPASGYVFDGWAGTGTGSYTGTATNATATVSASLTEVATFGAAPAHPVSSNGSSGSFWTSDAGIIALAVVGLVVGLVIGYVVFRSRRPPTGSSSGDAGTEGGSA